MAVNFPNSPSLNQIFTSGNNYFRWDGTSWRKVFEPTSLVRSLNTFTATSGQTTFTVGYEVGYVDVYVNGIRLSDADYTASNGRQVITNVGLTAGDTVDIVSVDSENTYWTRSQSDIYRNTGKVAIGTDTQNGDSYLTVGQVGAAGTSLFVYGGARITGILTVGEGSITLDGSNNEISLPGGLYLGSNAGIGSTTQQLKVGQQILAPDGIITSGSWSNLPNRLTTFTKASDNINDHTVAITVNDIIGGPGSNGQASFMVWFTMRRGNTTSSYSQKSEYLGYWNVTRQSSNLIHIDKTDLITRELTIDSIAGAGADTDTTTVTLTFDTSNVRSFTNKAIMFNAGSNIFPGSSA